jgi:invasion protein IalB
VAELKDASQVDVRFTMLDQSSVGIAVDLKGFAKAYDDLK